MPVAIGAARNGGLSHWLAATAHVPAPTLRGDAETDVCIIGGGFTGLWTAYYLKQAEPALRIAVLEARRCGFGASGRNGGWVSGQFVGSASAFARAVAGGPVRRFQRQLVDAVDEVGRVIARESMDVDFAKPGFIRVGRNPAQMGRIRAAVGESRSLGLADDEVRLLSADEVRQRVDVPSAEGGMLSAACARVQPAHLVRDLADAARRLGVAIFENSPVVDWAPRLAVTPRGVVRSRFVLRCTEGYTATLRGHRRTLLPMNSSMIVTAPLSDRQWDAVAWSGAELLQDAAHVFFYAQRTSDGRIALGGRGVPYQYGSRWNADGQTPARTVRQLATTLDRLFPQVEGLSIAHAWSGNLGVPRDWCPSVAVDLRTGLGHAGGYAGHGVAAANLAGRTLRDLILRHDTDLTRAPWVGHRSPRWEPEPIRALAVGSLYRLYALADRLEEATRAPDTSLVARAADRLTRRPS